MRDCSLGAAAPLRASLRIVFDLLTFFGLCDCWIPISAHSTTELPVPTSLSPYPVDLRTWTLRKSRWIANRDVRLERQLRLFPRSQAAFDMPWLGQCLNVGIDGRIHRREILIPREKCHDSRYEDAISTVWQIACNLQKVHVRTQKPSVKQRCAALDPSSPLVVTDQVARVSSDGFFPGKCGV